MSPALAQPAFRPPRERYPKTRFVDTKQAGKTNVPIATLRKKLGQRTFMTWAYACGLRDAGAESRYTGLVWFSVGGVAKHFGWSTASAERCVSRLTEAGLLTPAGWKAWKKARVLNRRVSGRAQPVLFMCVVPRSTERWLKASRHGGARPGTGGCNGLAGRPRKGETPAEARARRTGQVSVSIDAAVAVLSAEPQPFSCPEEIINRGGVKSQEGGTISLLRKDTDNSYLPTGERMRAAPSAAAVSNFVQKHRVQKLNLPRTAPRQTATAAALDSYPPPASSVPALLVPAPDASRAPAGGREGGEDGLRMGGGGGGGRGRLPRSWPTYPSLAVCKPAIVPSPAKLREDDSPDDHVVTMWNAYRALAEAKLPDLAWPLRRGNPGRYREKFAACAKLLIEQDIAPAAWASWSLDIWRKYSAERVGKGGKNTLPPVSWVFSADRVEERHGWFHSEEINYVGGTVLFGQAYRELGMRYSAATAYAVSTGDYERALTHYLPGDMYERLREKAIVEGREKQAELDARVARGDWIWG